ncbi:hypothetical protein Tco_0153270 [Tanacetum coccineum]
MATLISLINDNKNGKNVQVDMAGANQHTTYTDKELDNVLDISHLKIKVGHPNRTKAFISKIGNLKLSNDLILLGYPAKPVLNALRDSLQFYNKDQTMCCEIFQRAEQSRESFPLSDHTSKFLGDLVHLELWGPYKPCSACSRVFTGVIYGDHAISCAGIIGIKHWHNIVHDTLVDICFMSGVSAGKEVDIGLGGGRDKPLRPVVCYSTHGT